MRVTIFGLGYVGCVSAACLARMGHDVYGVDISHAKVRMINEGHSPVVEKGLGRLVSAAVRQGRLRASSQAGKAVEWADISMICVGTPSRPNGAANLDYVLRVVGEIGRALRGRRRPHVVVVRSTVPPGTMDCAVIPALERNSRKKAGVDFDVCFQPEFLREGSSIQDFFHPPRTVIGVCGRRKPRQLLKLWQPIKAPLFLTSLKVAEMVKYADNAFHALKVAFANEVGTLCKSLGIDSHEVMKIFVQDRKLNISPLYLRPGFAFGGPCLPKDLRALCSLGQNARLEVPLLDSVLESNDAHLRRATELVLATGKEKIAVLGLVFKSDTDDLRESPACALVKKLLQAKKEVRVYDPRVRLGRLIGANRAFVERELPALPKLLTASMQEAVASSQVVVVASKHPEFKQVAQGLKRGQVVVDLVGLPQPAVSPRTPILGLCW